MGTISLGDVAFLLLGDLIVNRLKWGWHIFVVVFCCFILTSSLAFYCYLEEITLEVSQDNSLCTKIQEQFHQTKQLLLKPNIFLVVLEVSLYSCLFYNMLTWYPYFFTVVGFP